MSVAAEHLRDEGTRAQTVAAGALAGLVSRFCIAPLDVLKIRLQLQYHSLADPLSEPLRHPSAAANVLSTAQDILRHEGIRGFWKGNIPAEGLYLSYGAIQFLAYRTTSQFLDTITPPQSKHANSADSMSLHLPSAAKSFVAGAIAGTAATTATYPLDLLRTRFAAQGTDRVYQGLISSIREITAQEGFRGFFRGLNAGIGQIVPYMGLFFALYESLKIPFSQAQLPFGSSDAMAGITASILGKSAVFPLDTVRKRLQIQGPTRARYIGGERIPVYEKGVVRTLTTILAREGGRGLYRGLSVSLVKAAPASAITMWTYERTIQFLQTMT